MNTPVGPLTLFEADGAIVCVEFGRAPDGAETALLTEAKSQLDRYFARELKEFDLPLCPPGSDHDRQVWYHMAEIPYGQTQTYGQLAIVVQSNARAVGTACGHNPIPIVIPCHRVVGADGKMTGYSGGSGVETKSALLALEGAVLL
jgi:methylated-DNA-[protein]-cysteine S-methyltransferase